jgi:hypothetical protein
MSESSAANFLRWLGDLIVLVYLLWEPVSKLFRPHFLIHFVWCLGRLVMVGGEVVRLLPPPMSRVGRP